MKKCKQSALRLSELDNTQQLQAASQHGGLNHDAAEFVQPHRNWSSRRALQYVSIVGRRCYRFKVFLSRVFSSAPADVQRTHVASLVSEAESRPAHITLSVTDQTNTQRKCTSPFDKGVMQCWWRFALNTVQWPEVRPSVEVAKRRHCTALGKSFQTLGIDSVPVVVGDLFCASAFHRVWLRGTQTRGSYCVVYWDKMTTTASTLDVILLKRPLLSRDTTVDVQHVGKH